MRYIFVPLSAVILFFPTFWFFSQIVGDKWGAGIAALFMYIVYPFMVLKFLERHDEVDDMTQELASGLLEMSEYSVKSVIEIKEFDDEGMFFLLEVGENKTLCLRGQYLYECTDGGSFPSSEIKILWNKNFGFTDSVEGTGNKLKPKRRLPPLNEKQWKLDSLPEDRDLIHKKIDEVAQIIEDNA